MTEPGTIVITGATGTVGRCLTRHLAGSWPGRLCMAGRARPGLMRAGDTFTECDLADPAATGQAAARIAAASPVTGLICCAGLDSRVGLPDLDVTAFTACMQVNCLAHLQLLRALVAARPATATVFPAVVISSDVIGRCMPATAAYAAAKAAAEEAFRHATADAPEPGIALLLVRLPDIGVPMRAAMPAPQPPAPGTRPAPAARPRRRSRGNHPVHHQPRTSLRGGMACLNGASQRPEPNPSPPGSWPARHIRRSAAPPRRDAHT